MIEEEHAKANVSLVNYELARQKHGWPDFQGQVSQKCITH